MSSEDEPSGTFFEFVNVTTDPLINRKSNTKIARAHAAKINRAIYRRKYVKQKVILLPKSELGTPTQHLSDADDEDDDLDSIEYPNLSVRGVLDELIYRGKNSSEVVSCRQCPYPAAHSKAQLSRELAYWQSTEPPLPTIPQQVSDGNIGESAKFRHHLLTTMWPIMAGKEATSAWFKEFSTHRLIFNVGHVAAAFNRDILAGEELWSRDRLVLQHKGSALEILQREVKRVDELGSEDIDRLIFAAITLARNELMPHYLDNDLVLLFSPHFPAAHWAGVVGRVRALKPHMRAVELLVQHQGGLKNVKIPLLAGTVAR
jgi:hypothetical protein